MPHRDTLASVLARWSTEVDPASLASGTRAKVDDSIVDTVGVAISGLEHPGFSGIRPLVGDAEPPATAASSLTTGRRSERWSDGARLSAPAAALANAAAGHLLDFDDTHYLIHGHPSTVVLPAALAAAQEAGASGADVVRGYIAGIGVMTAVARAFGPDHYARGWHSTSTCGTFGAAAAASVAAGLDLDQTMHALGSAASFSQGLRANFGTVLKPLHAGLAARAGVEAMLLARAGVESAPDAIDGRYGSLSLFGDGSWSRDAIDDLLRDAAEAPDGLGLKLYPCCRGAHFALDAALDVRRDLTEGDRVRTVLVTVPLGAKTALIHDDPQTGLEAKFSLPYAVATALVRGLPSVAHFEDDAVGDPAVRDLMSRMVVVEDPRDGDLSSTMTGRYADVEVTTEAGVRHRSRVDDAKGSATRPLSSSEVDDKFVSAVSASRGREGAGSLLRAMRGLSDLPDVRAAFAPPAR